MNVYIANKTAPAPLKPYKIYYSRILSDGRDCPMLEKAWVSLEYDNTEELFEFAHSAIADNLGIPNDKMHVTSILCPPNQRIFNVKYNTLKGLLAAYKSGELDKSINELLVNISIEGRAIVYKDEEEMFCMAPLHLILEALSLLGIPASKAWLNKANLKRSELVNDPHP